MTSMAGTPRPVWITFDCYGTLIQWDEGLLAAVRRILAGKDTDVEPARVIEAYDRHEHALERDKPHRSFKDVSGTALGLALGECGIACGDRDAAMLTDAIGAMPPFPEVVETLRALKGAGFRLCIVSNTDDAIIAGNVRQLGGWIDRVVTAERAGAYKPSPLIFEVAQRTIGVGRDGIVHVCASPHLDLVATRDLGLRDVWIDRGTGRRPPDGYRPGATLPSLDIVPAVFKDLGWM